jgi:hypothetical protein
VTSESLASPKTLLGCPGPATGAPYVDVWRALRPTDEGYTYWSYRFNSKAVNRGWRLDYFAVSPSLLPKVHRVFRRPHLHGASDHVPLGVVLDFPRMVAKAGTAANEATAASVADGGGAAVKKQASLKKFFGKAPAPPAEQ